MESLEFEGKNIEAALKKAEKALNLSRDKLEYETLSSGSSGIFGLVGAKNARIRVFARSSPDTVGDKGDIKNGETLSDREMVQSLLEETFSENGVADAVSVPEEHPPLADSSGNKVNGETVLDESAVFPGKELLQKILDQLTTDAKVTFQRTDNQIVFRVEGGNAAVLIGKRGQTLKAMQHLVEKVVWKTSGSKASVQVDVEHYMEKRATTLRDLAFRLAEKTKQTGKPSTINRIDAFERKIIHDALRKDKRIRTKSVGSGDFRNVVIQPGYRGKAPTNKASRK